jgi:uncharacterized protein
MPSSSEIFHKHKYINLETYRKSEQGVRTPVWFAQDGSTLYVTTDGTSGKARRIRRSHRVSLAPSDMRGTPLGEFVPALAELHTPGSPEFTRGNQLLNQKYGLMKKLFELMGRGRRGDPVVVVIKLEG